MEQSDLSGASPPFQVGQPPIGPPPGSGPPPSWPAPPAGSGPAPVGAPHQAFQSPSQGPVPTPTVQAQSKGTHWAVLVGLLFGGFVLGGFTVGLIMASIEEGSDSGSSNASSSAASGSTDVGDSAVGYADEETAEEAVARYTEELERRPDSAELYLWRGQSYEELYETELAGDDYGRAIELEPDNAEYYLARAELNRWWDSELAVPDYLAAIELEPGTAQHHLGLAGSYESLRDNEAALEQFSIALDLDPDNLTTYNSRGWLNLEMGNGPAAIADLTEVIDRDPTAASYSARASAHHQLGDFSKAIADYTEADQLDEDGTYYLTQRALVHIGNEDPEAALADYATAIQRDSRWGPYEQRGDLLWDLERYDEALADFDRAVETDDVLGRYRRGRALLELGRSSDALTDLDYVIDQDLNTAGYSYDYLTYDYGILLEDVIYLRALGRADVGDYEGAISDLDLVLNGIEGIDRPTRPGPVKAQIEQWMDELAQGTNPFE